MGSIATLSPRIGAELHQELIQHDEVTSLKCCPASVWDCFVLFPVAVLLSLAPERSGSICGALVPASLGASVGSPALPRALAGSGQDVFPQNDVHLCLCFFDSLALTPLLPGIAWCLCSFWLLQRALGLGSVG